ncbi:OsmC family peroxiredoxin [Thiohalomonas denitrificans]|uniref:OsmC family peroxiredoxin n=1 Tax=Thiohalomonas denitrificans TaxID=415747 RepID=UPI0026EC576B|nr:OsmC family peroxiredoxin [Thiohalomonas denitrificans]
MPIRNASAVWEGTLKAGAGRLKTESGSFEGRYTAASRFEEEEGTNPEELIGAAHAGCFSQAFSLSLEQAGFKPERIETSARVHLDKVPDGFAITRVELTTKARVPNIPEATFQSEAEKAKQTCPVSQALKAIDITLDAHLEQ